MSRIDNASLIVTTKAGSVAYNDEANILDENMTLANAEGNLTSLLVFAESMNVLRILSGTLLYPYISSLLEPNHEECILTHTKQQSLLMQVWEGYVSFSSFVSHCLSHIQTVNSYSFSSSVSSAVGVLFVIERRTQPSRLPVNHSEERLPSESCLCKHLKNQKKRPSGHQILCLIW